MAKPFKTRISWKSSRSRQVVGYKLYWTRGETLNYRSKCANLGDVKEIILPDALAAFNLHRGRLKFGLTAVSDDGNESDILTIGSLSLFDPPSQRLLRTRPSSQKLRQARPPLNRVPTALKLRETNRLLSGLRQTGSPQQATGPGFEAAPVACFSDPVKQRLFLQLNFDQTRVNQLDRVSGLEPLLAHESSVSRKTIQEARDTLLKFSEQLDEVFPED